MPAAGDDWDLLWSFEIPRPAVFRRRRPGTLVNHFPGSATLHFKDELAHFLAAAGAEFHPRTWPMPGGEAAWRVAAAADPDAIWIVKPRDRQGGEGMRITRDPSSVAVQAGTVVQEYVADPLLLPGEPCKHVLRIYVLVTSLVPLRAWIHPEAPVKYASRPFAVGDGDLDDLARHLTNPSIQRAAGEPVRCITMPAYGDRLREAGHHPAVVWDRIRDVTRRTVEAHLDPIRRVSGYVTPDLDGCFELLGFDILVDATLRPWVIECNVSPALGARGSDGSPAQAAQRRAKETMVGDVVGMVLAGDPGRFEPL